MRRTLVTLPWLLCGFATLAFSVAKTKLPAQKPWWEGTVEGVRVLLGPDDLQFTSKHGGQDLIVSFKKDFEYESQKTLANEEPGADRSEVHKPLSLVGPYLSLRTRYTAYFPGTAHPLAVASFVTIDVRDTKKTVTLSDFFEEKVLFQALMADKVVATSLSKKAKIAKLKELIAILSKVNTPCEYAFSPEMLQSFAFHSVKKNRVAVRIALSHGCEAARGTTTELGLSLPIPESLKRPLADAVSGETGFLMDNAKEIFKGKEIQLYAEKPSNSLPHR